MAKQLTEVIAEQEKRREHYRKMITVILRGVGDYYQTKGVAELSLHQGRDVHAFYRLAKDPTKVIHVQGYPGMSTDKQARVWARMMNYDKMIRLREGGVAIGNEHAATIKDFPDFTAGGIMIPYNSKYLEEMLTENVPELR